MIYHTPDEHTWLTGVMIYHTPDEHTWLTRGAHLECGISWAPVSQVCSSDIPHSRWAHLANQGLMIYHTPDEHTWLAIYHTPDEHTWLTGARTHDIPHSRWAHLANRGEPMVYHTPDEHTWLTGAHDIPHSRWAHLANRGSWYTTSRLAHLCSSGARTHGIPHSRWARGSWYSQVCSSPDEPRLARGSVCISWAPVSQVCSSGVWYIRWAPG